MEERRLIVISCVLLFPALAYACRTLDARRQERAEPEPALEPPETVDVFYPSTQRPQAKKFEPKLERRCFGTHIVNGICPEIDTSNLEWGPPLERRTNKKTQDGN